MLAVRRPYGWSDPANCGVGPFADVRPLFGLRVLLHGDACFTPHAFGGDPQNFFPRDQYAPEVTGALDPAELDIPLDRVFRHVEKLGRTLDRILEFVELKLKEVQAQCYNQNACPSSDIPSRPDTHAYWITLNGVTIPKAVLVLRKKTGLDQVTFAALAETTPETVSRWERGHRAPNPEALSKLAAIAQSNKQTRLAKIFESKLKARIATRIRNLPSKRTQRRISLEDLKFNAAVARDLIKALRAMVERVEKDFPTAGWLTDGHGMLNSTLGASSKRLNYTYPSTTDGTALRRTRSSYSVHRN